MFLFNIDWISNIIYLDRVSLSSSPQSFLNDQERKPISFPHYSHHRHESSSSSIHKTEHNDIHRPFLNAIKAQRHSDPYSIKWITEGPYRNIDDYVNNWNYNREFWKCNSVFLNSLDNTSSDRLYLLWTTPFVLYDSHMIDNMDHWNVGQQWLC